MNNSDLETFEKRRVEFCAKFMDGEMHADALVQRWLKKNEMSSADDGSFVYQRFVGHKI